MYEDDLISRQAAIDALDGICDRECEYPKKQRAVMCAAFQLESAFDAIDELPSAQPEQLEQCPIYGGMCAYPSDQCYDCPRHAGARMEVTT